MWGQERCFSPRSERGSVHVIVAAVLLVMVGVLSTIMLGVGLRGEAEGNTRVIPVVVEEVLPGWVVVRNIGSQEAVVDALVIRDAYDKRLLGHFKVGPFQLEPGEVQLILIPSGLEGKAGYGREVIYTPSGPTGSGGSERGPYQPILGFTISVLEPKSGFTLLASHQVAEGDNLAYALTLPPDVSSYNLIARAGSGEALLVGGVQFMANSGGAHRLSAGLYASIMLSNLTAPVSGMYPTLVFHDLNGITGAVLVNYTFAGQGPYEEDLIRIQPVNTALPDRPAVLGTLYDTVTGRLILVGYHEVLRVNLTLGKTGVHSVNYVTVYDPTTGVADTGLFWITSNALDYSTTTNYAILKPDVIKGLISPPYTVASNKALMTIRGNSLYIFSQYSTTDKHIILNVTLSPTIAPSGHLFSISDTNELLDPTLPLNRLGNMPTAVFVGDSLYIAGDVQHSSPYLIKVNLTTLSPEWIRAYSIPGAEGNLTDTTLAYAAGRLYLITEVIKPLSPPTLLEPPTHFIVVEIDPATGEPLSATKIGLRLHRGGVEIPWKINQAYTATRQGADLIGLALRAPEPLDTTVSIQETTAIFIQINPQVLSLLTGNVPLTPLTTGPYTLEMTLEGAQATRNTTLETTITNNVNPNVAFIPIAVLPGQPGGFAVAPTLNAANVTTPSYLGVTVKQASAALNLTQEIVG